MSASPIFADATVRIAVDRAICAVRWAQAPSAQHFEHVARGLRAAAADAGQAALLNVIDGAGAARFDEPARRAAADMVGIVKPFTTGVAHVILIDGFRGAAVRMFVSTVTLLSRSAVPTTVHSSLPAGIDWICQRTPAANEEVVQRTFAALRD